MTDIMKNQVNDTKPVAVIILNWNGAHLLREYLPSVVKHTPQEIAEVIVADNGSTDDSLKVLAEEFPMVKVMAFDTNYGFAEGYNKALLATSNKYTVLLNSDVAVKDDWLTPLYRFMETHEEYAGCQPKIRSYLRPEMFEYAGAAGGFIDCNGYPFCRGRIFAEVEHDRGQYDGDPIDIDWATGACLMVCTELYNRVGGLDKHFFAHMEEIDLCWRLRAEGYRLAAVTDAAVYHLGGGSLPAENPRKTYLNFRNSLLMLHKNLPQKRRGFMLIKRRLLDTLAWCMFMAKGDLANAKAILKAHHDFRTMRDNLYTRPSGTLDLPSAPNLLTGYYLRGRRTYSAITR